MMLMMMESGDSGAMSLRKVTSVSLMMEVSRFLFFIFIGREMGRRGRVNGAVVFWLLFFS